MYLLDTNICLERLLDQQQSKEVERLLNILPSDDILITDFSFHSIGVIFNRLGEREALLSFVQDLFLEGEVTLIALRPENMVRVVEVMQQFNLDFDDAYQYVAAELCDAVLVSLDSDFQRSERGRKTPTDVLRTL